MLCGPHGLCCNFWAWPLETKAAIGSPEKNGVATFQSNLFMDTEISWQSPHIMKSSSSSDFFQPFKNVEAILSLWTTQTAGKIAVPQAAVFSITGAKITYANRLLQTRWICTKYLTNALQKCQGLGKVERTVKLAQISGDGGNLKTKCEVESWISGTERGH